jgi:hypothetical protein
MKLNLNSMRLYRSIEGKYEIIDVWMLEHKPHVWLVKQRGCWQIWHKGMVENNWFITKHEAVQNELAQRQQILKEALRMSKKEVEPGVAKINRDVIVFQRKTLAKLQRQYRRMKQDE